MEPLFPSIDPEDEVEEEQPRPGRLRDVSFKSMLPSLVTLLALCAGLTSIRLGIEGRFELAVGAVVIAALLDAVDGRVARLLKSASKFGAELDSLADFVNFGVAPAVLLYIWILSALESLGWTAALAFAICGGLRLARFNSQLEVPGPAWKKDYFQGVPAPAGALTVLMPLAVAQAGVPVSEDWAGVVSVYTLFVGLLMVSSLPTFSGKRMGEHIPRSAVLPVMIAAVVFIALLVSYLFVVLSVGAVLYLAHLPFAYRAYRRRALGDAAA